MINIFSGCPDISAIMKNYDQKRCHLLSNPVYLEVVRILVIYILFVCQGLFASPVIDSLRQAITHAKGSKKVGLGFQLAQEYTKNSQPEALSCSHAALKWAHDLNDQQLLATALHNLGYVHYRFGQLDSAFKYLQNALQIRKGLSDSSGMAYSLNRLGNVYWFKNKPLKAKHCFEQALKIRQQLGQDQEIGVTLTNLGNLYRQWSDHQAALDYYLSALRHYESANYIEGLGWLYFSTAILHKKLKNYAKAFEHINQSLSYYRKFVQTSGDSAGLMICFAQLGDLNLLVGNLDQALHYHLAALRLRKKSGVAPAIADGLSGVGRVYYAMQKYSRALDYFKQALALRERSGINAGLVTDLKYKGYIFDRLGQTEKALNYLERALAMARNAKERDNERNILARISDIYAQKGQHEQALNYYKQHTAVKDSIYNYKVSSRLSALQIQYETEKQAEENHRLAQENRINALQLVRQRNFRNYLLVLIVLGGMVIITFIFLYRSKLRDNRLLGDKNRQITQAHRQLEEEIAERKQVERERENLINKLQASLDKIKTLRGLIPICASCKKIRDDKGYWQQVEEYICLHSDVQFSHSICPACMQALYPDYCEENSKNKEDKSNKNNRDKTD